MADELGIERALEPFRSAKSIDVFENGKRVGAFESFQYEVSRKGGHTLLHVWSQERNLVRRVLRLELESDVRVILETQQFGRKRPGKLEIMCLGRQGSPHQRSRESFCGRIARLLGEQFPDEQLELLTTASDLQHSFSGCYSRGLLRRERRAWAVIAVGAGEDEQTIDEILTYGLIWLSWARRHSKNWSIEGLRLLLPQGASQLTQHRIQALTGDGRFELYEVHEPTNRLCPIDVQDVGNLATGLAPRRGLEYTLDEAGVWVDRIRRTAPDAIGVGTPPGTRDVAFRFRGLEIARWRRGKLQFGIEGNRRELTADCWKEFERLVGELQKYRHPYALDTSHPLYRAQPERWLEAIVQGDPLRVHPRLDPARVYSQVPAMAAGNRGVLDLLGVTLDGRLVIMELKASEDIHLMMQALDYWLRVRWHQKQGSFHTFGYFTGVELQDKAPLLLLVAPGLRFHPAMDILLPFLKREVEVMRVGLNENWRQGLQVLFRQ